MNYNHPSTAGRDYSGNLTHPSEKRNEYNEWSMKDHFEQTLRDQANNLAKEKFRNVPSDGWLSGSDFEVVWIDGSDENPAGLLIKDGNQNDKYIDSKIPGLHRVLKQIGYTFVMLYDGRCRNSESERGIIVTGHEMTGGRFPQEILDEIGAVEVEA